MQHAPRAPRWGRFARQDVRAAYCMAMADYARDVGAIVVRIVTTPHLFPRGAWCVVLDVDGKFQRAWFHGRSRAAPRLNGAYLVHAAVGPGPFEKRKTALWVGTASSTGIVCRLPTWAWTSIAVSAPEGNEHS